MLSLTVLSDIIFEEARGVRIETVAKTLKLISLTVKTYLSSLSVSFRVYFPPKGALMLCPLVFT